jgi:hypothetical protein
MSHCHQTSRNSNQEATRIWTSGHHSLKCDEFQYYSLLLSIYLLCYIYYLFLCTYVRIVKINKNLTSEEFLMMSCWVILVAVCDEKQWKGSRSEVW